MASVEASAESGRDLARVRDHLSQARDHVERLIERIEAGAEIAPSTIEVAASYLAAAERSLHDLPLVVDHTLEEAARLLETLGSDAVDSDEFREQARLVSAVIRLHLMGE